MLHAPPFDPEAACLQALLRVFLSLDIFIFVLLSSLLKGLAGSINTAMLKRGLIYSYYKWGRLRSKQLLFTSQGRLLTTGLFSPTLQGLEEQHSKVNSTLISTELVGIFLIKVLIVITLWAINAVSRS